MARLHNFSAGPAALPLPVLEAARENLLDHEGAGASIMELSHRSPEYQAIHDETIQRLRDLLGLAPDRQVLLLPGGGRLQFALLPLNLLGQARRADYIVTGRWSEIALDEARTVGAARAAATTRGPGGFTRVATAAELQLDPGAVYCHLTSNSTIEGVQWGSFPETGPVPLAADMSSDFLSRRFDPRPFGVIYAAAQKNLGPAGMSVVIIRRDLLEQCRTDLPLALSYRTHAAADSLYFTPPVFAIYMAALTLRWIHEKGGLDAIERENRAKAALIYAVIDSAGAFYQAPAASDSRSFQNIVFRLPTPDLDERFVAEARRAGLIGLKGHRSVGGIRVSLYNGVARESARILADFMSEFLRRHG